MLDGQRRNVPEFFVEAEPATLRRYAVFLQAGRSADQDLEGFLPAEDLARPGPRQASLLRLHLEGGGEGARVALPEEPLLPVEAAAEARYLEWTGLRPLTRWERQRAFEAAGVPLHDVRGGISPRAR